MKLNELKDQLAVGDSIEVYLKGSHGGHFIRKNAKVLDIIEKNGKTTVKYSFTHQDFYEPKKEGGGVSGSISDGREQTARTGIVNVTKV